MDRSEGAEPKGRKASLFQTRDGGKPCVAQPPQRDSKNRAAVATQLITEEARNFCSGFLL